MRGGRPAAASPPPHPPRPRRPPPPQRPPLSYSPPRRSRRQLGNSRAAESGSAARTDRPVPVLPGGPPVRARPPRSKSERCTAIDHNGRAVHEPGLLRAEEGHDLAEIQRIAHHSRASELTHAV